MTTHHAAIESAQAAVILSLRRLEGSLRHLFALMAGEVANPSLPPQPPAATPRPAPPREVVFSPRPAPAPGQHGGDRRTPRYTLNGQPMFLKDMAALAGCGTQAFEQRLYAGMTPEEAVAAGPRMARGTRKPQQAPAGQMLASWPPAAPTPRPTAAPAAPTPVPTAPPAATDPTPAPSPYGFSVFNPRPVPAHLVNTKPGLPREPETRKVAS